MKFIKNTKFQIHNEAIEITLNSKSWEMAFIMNIHYKKAIVHIVNITVHCN